MKSFSIIAGALLGTIALVAGAIYFGVTHYSRLMAEFGPELSFNTQARAQAAETKLKQAPDAYSRWVALGDAAFWKAAQPNDSDASALATELLGMTETYKTDWNFGNAMHKANSALGRIALRSGDKAAARKYLLASANSKGSPQMNSFGPNMGFAKEMLEAGEKESVLEYLRLCGTFWAMGHDQLEVWDKMIRENRASHFGANLLY